MRIAVLGLGFMGSTHLAAIRNIPAAELIAVASDDIAKLAGGFQAVRGNLDRSAGRLDLSGVRQYASIEDALAGNDVEAVDICLPTWLHEQAAIAALNAGKHVLVEKPMALDGDGCARMLAAAARADRLLMTAQVVRFWPDYQPLIETVRAGRLGPVRAALFRRRCAAPAWGEWLQDPSKSGGAIVDLLIHDADLCIHLFGLPEAVSATGFEDPKAGIDVVTAFLHYPNIPSVVISGGWRHPASYPFSMEYTVSFDRATIEFSTAGQPPTQHSADGATPLPVPDQDAFQAEIQYFLECAATKRTPDRCPPRESAASVRLARWIAEARSRKGEKIACKF